MDRIENLRAYARIDLDAIISNLKKMKENLSQDTAVMAVIKADGYGHGSVEIAGELEKEDFIWGYAVATAEEAMELRNAGIKKNILLLGAAPVDCYKKLIENDIQLCLFSKENAGDIIATAKKLGKAAVVHIKTDTGMGRIGFSADETGKNQIIELSAQKELTFKDIFTHFSKADERDRTHAKGQLDKFNHIIDVLRQSGVEFPIHHCANSAGILESIGVEKEVVRAGIAMYGLRPSNEVAFEGYIPAMSLCSTIVHIKDVAEGTLIGYGGAFEANKQMRVATVSIGYADGYPRALSGKAHVLVGGRRVPIIGRICMDMLMIDVTRIENLSVGDEVVLFGKQGKEYISVEELAMESGKFNYEFVCGISRRIPRLYYRNNKKIYEANYILQGQTFS